MAHPSTFFLLLCFACLFAQKPGFYAINSLDLGTHALKELWRGPLDVNSVLGDLVVYKDRVYFVADGIWSVSINSGTPILHVKEGLLIEAGAPSLAPTDYYLYFSNITNIARVVRDGSDPQIVTVLKPKDLSANTEYVQAVHSLSDTTAVFTSLEINVHDYCYLWSVNFNATPLAPVKLSQHRTFCNVPYINNMQDLILYTAYESVNNSIWQVSYKPGQASLVPSQLADYVEAQLLSELSGMDVTPDLQTLFMANNNNLGLRGVLGSLPYNNTAKANWKEVWAEDNVFVGPIDLYENKIVFAYLHYPYIPPA